jgi:small neutral amino acid transporter SnatA (MarC family)
MRGLRRATLSLAITTLAAVGAAGAIVVPVACAATPTATAGTQTPTPGPAAGTTTVPAASPAPTSPSTTRVTIHHNSGDRTAAVALLVLVGGLLAIAALVWAAVSWSAQEPEWMLRARHATGEAGWRISNTWAEFVDFLRLGR